MLELEVKEANVIAIKTVIQCILNAGMVLEFVKRNPGASAIEREATDYYH